MVITKEKREMNSEDKNMANACICVRKGQSELRRGQDIIVIKGNVTSEK